MIETYFLDNDIYKPIDVRNAFCTFTSQGIDVFENCDNLPADLNAAFSKLATNGVLSLNGNECQVISDNGFKLLKGAVMTENGIICFDTVSITPESGTTYIGLEGTNIYVGSTLPVTNYIPFAQITNDVITDMRQFAKAKIQTPCYSGGVEYGEVVFTGPGEIEYAPHIPIKPNAYTRRCYMLNQRFPDPIELSTTVFYPKEILQRGDAGLTIGWGPTNGIYYVKSRNGNVVFTAAQRTPQGSTYHGGTLQFLLY